MFSESEYPSHLTVQVPPRGVSKAADEVLPCHCCCHLGCVPRFFFYEYQGKRHWGRWWESLGQALIAQQICALLHFFNTAEPRAFLPQKIMPAANLTHCVMFCSELTASLLWASPTQVIYTDHHESLLWQPLVLYEGSPGKAGFKASISYSYFHFHPSKHICAYPHIISGVYYCWKQ